MEELRWVRLQVIAGAKQDRLAQIDLADVFVPQLATSGLPTYEIPDEILEYRRHLFFVQSDAEDAEGADTVSDDRSSQEEDANTGAASEGLPRELSLEIIGREPTQVILGGPGSGKSTLVHFAMLHLCGHTCGESGLFTHLDRSMVPFLVELRQYVLKKSPDFVDYLAVTAAERYAAPLEALDIRATLELPGGSIVFFDGLDEVFDPADRERVIQQFRTFARKYPNTRIVVTSRIVGYDRADLGVAGFRHYSLLDFGVQQIRDFVLRWYTHYTWEGDRADAHALIQRIFESPRLLELAGNPLLLTMMGIIAKHQDLPEERWKLYERCTDVLLEDWDIKRKKIDRQILLRLEIPIRAAQKAEILQRVATYMLERGQTGRELNAIAYRPLLEILALYLVEVYSMSRGEAAATAEEILNHLRERTYILAEVGEHIFGFVHRTFMEYFVARHLQAQFNTREADFQWLNSAVFDVHWRQPEWQEVLFLLVAMLAGQNTPIKKIIDYLRDQSAPRFPDHMVFAARCLAEAGAIKDPDQGAELVNDMVEAISRFCDGRASGSEQFVNGALKAFSLLAPLVSPPPSRAVDGIASLEKGGASSGVWPDGKCL